MKSQLKLTHGIASYGLVLLIVTVLVLGVVFRFVNLDQKPYWADEVHTGVLVSGHSFEEQRQQLQTGQVITIEDLHRFQHPDPEKNVLENVSATIRNLATQDNRHTPLYYSLLTIWIKLFGYSVAATRSFSVLLSLLALPCLYWLCRELFEAPIVAWMATALMAISPAFILYAQDARPYSLWIFIIILSNLLLLRAMRLKTGWSWFAYGTTIPLGLYTHILFVLVAIAQAAYVAVIARLRFSKTLISYALAAIGGSLTFIPWALVILLIKPRFDAQSEWQLDQQGFVAAVVRWVGIISRGFVDFGVGPGDSLQRSLPLIPIILALLALILFSFYFLWHHAPKRVSLFLLLLVGATGLTLMLPDILLGQRRGTTRFILPCIVGMQLSLAYLFSSQIGAFAPNLRKQKLWQMIMVTVFSLGILSCYSYAQADIWWNKGLDENKHNAQIARTINQSPQPLLISNGLVKPVQVLSYKLDPKVRFQLLAESSLTKPAAGFSDTFLFNSSEEFRTELQQKYNLELTRVVGTLWRIENP